jgi:hypothetical protein
VRERRATGARVVTLTDRVIDALRWVLAAIVACIVLVWL